jgi:hypothetical protein
MRKDKLFAYYLQKNPSLFTQLENGKVTLTASGFRKFFNTTYDAAYKQGFNQLPDTEDEELDDYEERRTYGNSASINDLLNLFGMK